MVKAVFQHVDEYVEQYQANNFADSKAVRAKAAQDIQQYGFPNYQTESWKYTPSKALLAAEFESAALAEVTAQELSSLKLDNTHRLTFVNGYYAPEHSTIDAKNIAIKPLAQASEYLGKSASTENTGFVALNTMLFQHGYSIEITANLDKPLHLLHIAKNLMGERIIQGREVIVLGEAVQATILEQYVAINAEQYWRNQVNEYFLKADSALSYIKLQQEALNAYHTDYSSVEQASASRLTSLVMNTGAGLSRHDYLTHLNEVDASCILNGVYLVENNQHVDNHTCIEHIAPKTYSTQCYKGIMDDKAHGVFNGRVLVKPQAQKIESAQKNANLLLSKDAEIDTKPELEIYADDVKCSHGATVGQLDQTAIFYLKSRGIDEAQARDLLVYGFAYERIAQVENAELRELLKRHLLTWCTSDNELTETLV